MVSYLRTRYEEETEVKKISNGYQLCQKKYINDLLRRFGMENCKPQSTPLKTGFSIDSSDSPTTAAEKEKMAEKGYKELVGALLWVARVSRPDIQVAVSITLQIYCEPI